jgi:glyoxylate reductase
MREEDGRLDEEGMARLCAGAEGVLATLADPVGGGVLERLAPPLRVVSLFAVGYDNVDLDAAERLGVTVTNTPGVLSGATAEIALSLLLGLFRRIAEGEALLRSGGFRGWEPTLLLGHDLAGKTLGVFGFGGVGQAVAARAAAFGMEILYCSRGPVPAETEARLAARRVSFDELIASSDAITLHAPSTPETRGLFSEAVLRRMKKGAYFVNTARGPLVDERGLARLLREGHLAGAGFDVYDGEPRVDPELLAAPRTLLLPHLGSATWETRGRMAELAAEAILDVLSGRPPAHRVTRRAAAAAGGETR